MSLRTAAALTKGIADDSERAVRAAKAFPGLQGAPGPSGGASGVGLGLAQLREALVPILAGLDTITAAVTETAGKSMLLARRFGG